MKKGIEIFIDGNFKRFLERWTIPEGVILKSDIEFLRFFLLDTMTGHYDDIKRIVSGLDDVQMESSFFIRDVTSDDCDKVELLHFQPYSTDGIGLTESFADRFEIMKKKELAVYSRRKPAGRIYLYTESGLHLFNEKLIEKINKGKLGENLIFIPLNFDGSCKNIKGWYAAFSTHDLGRADIHEKFIPEFNRNNWNGEHFNTSTEYLKGFSFFVTQDVKKLFLGLSEKQRGEVSFEPVVLV
jgi:hypothetical protein